MPAALERSQYKTADRSAILRWCKKDPTPRCSAARFFAENEFGIAGYMVYYLSVLAFKYTNDMSFLHYAAIGVLVPALIKKTPAALKRIFKLLAIDDATKARVAAKAYPRYYKIGYALWLLCLFSSGFIAFGYIAFYLPAAFVDFDYASEYWKFIALGLINMIGAWLIVGAILDMIFWSLSSVNFRDYVRYRNIKEGMDVEMPEQIRTLWKIGIGYYILFSPILYFLLR